MTKDKIIINSACNNVSPLIYSDWEVARTDESMRNLFRDLGGYCLQPQDGANGGKWKWIMLHPCMKNAWYLGKKKDQYWNEERDGEYPSQEQLESNYQTFLGLIEMSVKEVEKALLELHPGKYILECADGMHNGWYFVRRNRERTYRCCPDISRATTFNYYEVVEITKKYNAKIIQR